MADEPVRITTMVPARVKDAMVDRFGPRGIGKAIVEAWDAFTSNAPREPREQVDLEAREDVQEPREEPRASDALRNTETVWPSQEEMLKDLFGGKFMEKIHERCAVTGKGVTETIRNATLAMIEQRPPTRRAQLSEQVELETAGLAGCKHDWQEPVFKFGRKTQFCKKDGCNARRVWRS